MIICAIFILDCNAINLILELIDDDAPFLLSKALFQSSIVLMKSSHKWLHYVASHNLFSDGENYDNNTRSHFQQWSNPLESL